jgi:hypothetical protein
MYNQDNEGRLPPEVVRVKNEIARADGVLIVTLGTRPLHGDIGDDSTKKFLADFVDRFADLVTRLAPAAAEASAA